MCSLPTFFPFIGHGDEGLGERDRVLVIGGLILAMDSATDEPFSALFARTLACDSDWWSRRGSCCETGCTQVTVASLKGAEELISFHGAARGRRPGSALSQHMAFHVAQYSRRAGEREAR